jgi:hypothetical protein
MLSWRCASRVICLVWTPDATRRPEREPCERWHARSGSERRVGIRLHTFAEPSFFVCGQPRLPWRAGKSGSWWPLVWTLRTQLWTQGARAFNAERVNGFAGRRYYSEWADANEPLAVVAAGREFDSPHRTGARSHWDFPSLFRRSWILTWRHNGTTTCSSFTRLDASVISRRTSRCIGCSF